MIRKITVKRVAPALAFILLLIALRISDIDQYFTFSAFNNSKAILFNFVQAHYAGSIFIFISLYIFLSTFVLPSTTVLTVAGGFLFGIVPGLMYVMIGAHLGALSGFFSGRYLFGNRLQKRFSKQLETFNRNIKDNAVSYLLTLRLIPIFPFSVINILAGLTKVDLFTFMWTTFVGIFPASFLYIYMGQKIGAAQTLSDIVSPTMLWALGGLGLLGLFPLILKKIRQKPL